MAIESDLQAPAFLVAVPQLGDANFARSVVFILEHGEEGSMGLIINRASSLPMDAFCASQGMQFAGDGQKLVHQGGPVQSDRAFILHGAGHEGPETERVADDICLSYSLESLKALAAAPPPYLRVYLGYAGWGPDQLAKEITAGAWLLGTASTRLVFDTPPEDIWDASLKDMGIEAVQLMHSGTLH